MASTEEQLKFDQRIFRPDAMARAMRDSRYRHPANAIAELIDNSIDAKASIVELLVEQQRRKVTERRRLRVSELAVADNGVGMDPAALVEALSFGGRTAPRAQVHMIGKYGVGLPTASATQSRRVDIWTWQDTIANSWYCYLDLAEVERTGLDQLPYPERAALPEKWNARLASEIRDSQSGTVVLWSDLREITQRPQTIFNELQQEVGRIYRHFLATSEVQIRMIPFAGEDNVVQEPLPLRPNDPLFLMHNSATSPPWDEVPMFEVYPPGQEEGFSFPVTVEGREEVVRVKYSIVKADALGDQAQNPGNLPHGKDAQRNTGVSIVREGRELLMEDVFAHVPGRREQPQNRWWGCEVQFDKGCDNLLGVDHNKQMAAALSDMARRLGKSDDSDTHNSEQYADDPLYVIVEHIRSTTRSMTRDIVKIFSNRRRPEPETEETSAEQEAEKRATEAVEEQIRETGVQTETDRVREETPDEERIQALTKYLEDKSVPNAEEQARDIVRRAFAYRFMADELAGSQMFHVESTVGVLFVYLNIKHPLYSFLNFLEARKDEPKAQRAAVAIRVLLLAWARMEDQTHDQRRRTEREDIRIDWGRAASDVLEQIVAEVEATDL